MRRIYFLIPPFNGCSPQIQKKQWNALFPALHVNVKVLMFSFTWICLLILVAHLLLPHAWISRLCLLSNDCSYFWIIVNFCPNPQPITLSHMYVVKLFIILLPICPALLTWIPFFDVLALSEVLEICFLECSCLNSENRSFRVMPRKRWSFGLVLQKGGFSLAWNL